jgi:hypothetical protein
MKYVYVTEMASGGMICQFLNDRFRKSNNIKVITSTV